MEGGPTQILAPGSAVLSDDAARPCCPLRYRLPLINSKPAILLFVWNGLVMSCALFLYSSNDLTLKVLSQESQDSISAVVASVTSPNLVKLFSPLFGWLADAWLGRFRVLWGSLIVLLLATLLQGACLTWYATHDDATVLEPLACFVAALASIGQVCFLANIIQFITDHLVGASGYALSFTVYWVVWSEFFAVEVANILLCSLVEVDLLAYWIVMLVCVTVFLLFALVFVCATKHLLSTTPQITNPLRQIVRVLRYACQHKTPVNRSALTYWEEDYPSRINIGKDKYGGPFTEEEVEDVKTTLGLLPLIVCASASAIGLSTDNLMKVLEPFDGYCYVYDLSSPLLVLFIPTFYFIVFPLSYNCMPSMLKRIGVGILFMVLNLFFAAAIDVTGTAFLEDNSSTCAFASNGTQLPLSMLWAMGPELCFTLGEFLASITLLEFVLAQSPLQMKGLLIGLVFGFSGVYVGIGKGAAALLPMYFPEYAFPGCGFWTFSILGGFVAIAFVFFLIVSNNYKLRSRNNPYNTYAVTADHYARYLEQEEEWSLRTEPQQSVVMDDSFSLLFHKVL